LQALDLGHAHYPLIIIEVAHDPTINMLHMCCRAGGIAHAMQVETC